MYKELTKFKTNNHFNFTIDNSLEEVCNASENGSGVFLVYAVDGEEKELIIVGWTGTIKNDGSLKKKNIEQ